MLQLDFQFITLDKKANMNDKESKIGVIGSGIVGRVLASAFIKEGYDVMLGTRDVTKAEAVTWQQQNEKGKLGTFSETAAFGGIIILATKGTVVKSAIEIAGINNFSDKIIIDTTNPIADKPPVNGVLQYFTSLDNSLMEQVQTALPQAKVVKAFNSVGNALMYKPQLPGGKPTMFICGNDDGAKETVKEILETFGWEVEDLGKAEAARAIEPLCILWCIPGFINNTWMHALKLLKA
ncbi:MAG: DNA-binding protein [Chitinophagaceae bacterium]|nr:DNA-binding protein [Chitinophagaceae bacterium]